MSEGVDMSRGRGSRLVGILALGTILIAGPAVLPSVSAARTRTVLNFGPLGVSVGNVNKPSQALVSVTNITGGSRQAEVKVIDEAGTVLAQQRLTIAAGDTGQVLANFTAGDGQVAYARARVSASGTWLRSAPISMQGIDGNGGPASSTWGDTRTAAFSSGEDGISYVWGPMTSIPAGYSLRIAVTNVGKAQASFTTSLIGTTWGGDGRPLAELPNVAPGATAWATFPSETATNMRPEIEGPAGSKIIATAQLVDSASGEVATTVILDIMGYGD